MLKLITFIKPYYTHTNNIYICTLAILWLARKTVNQDTIGKFWTNYYVGVSVYSIIALYVIDSADISKCVFNSWCYM